MADEPVHSVTQGATRVAQTAIGAMAGSPLSLALLLVNLVFLGVGAYILGEVAETSRERNKTQNDLISTLVKDIRDCRQPARPTFLPWNIDAAPLWDIQQGATPR